MSPWIASPGRFQTDVTRLKSGNGEGWYDMLGNLGEYTGDFSSPSLDFCDFSVAPAAGATTCTRSLKPAGSVGTLYTGIPRSGVIGRSWEGHNYGRGTTGGFQVTFQYGKFGGRCVRPAQ
jgi:formylglycine-generating enzyme required for sulfatase activity